MFLIKLFEFSLSLRKQFTSLLCIIAQPCWHKQHSMSNKGLSSHVYMCIFVFKQATRPMHPSCHDLDDLDKTICGISLPVFRSKSDVSHNYTYHLPITLMTDGSEVLSIKNCDQLPEPIHIYKKRQYIFYLFEKI